jgi:hypothetical protein
MRCGRLVGQGEGVAGGRGGGGDGDKGAIMGQDKVRVVYHPATPEEAERRCKRVEALVGTPFVSLPGNVPDHKVLFIASNGYKVRKSDVEMVYNDCLLSDAVSNWGEDGPLYESTLDNPLHAEVFEYARKAYFGVSLPNAYVNPKSKQ